MILIINVCKESLHYFEFVKPVEDTLSSKNKSFLTKNYKELSMEDIEKADKIIICGTALADNEFLDNIEKFSWVCNFDKPILGICSGMQIIGLVYGGVLKRYLEIGYFYENFSREFLGMTGRQEVYHLHNNYIEFSGDFEVFSDGEIPQAIKHRKKEVYGVLFHPEVRHKEMIKRFIEL